jgi:CRISPR-associated protein Csy1
MRWRNRYTEGLARLVAEIPRWLARPADVLDLNRNNFLLAYQGEDDRELQRQYSGLLARLAGAVHPEWREARRSTFDGGRRLRIGFVSSIFRDCTAGRYFERWITGLDARRFERFVYHTSVIDDDFTRRIAAGCEHFATLRGGAPLIASQLAADALDVIVYPEVGMTPASYLLAALRLAPLQCAGWGHPVTTGSDAIDCYLTCVAMEPPDGASHYVERLVGLPGLGVDYSMPQPPPAAAPAEFGLPANARIYLCAQSLFKVHPEMDALLADILEADPEGVVVFFQAPVRAVTRQFSRRLQRVLEARGIPARGQLKFLPRMSGAHFRRALAAADVVLDTVRWSGGNTSLDAFAAGTPVVALTGRFMRGRQTATMLEMAGVAELVAAGPADYVRIAVGVASDRERNRGLREAIARGRSALFDRREPIAALEEALLAAAAAKS